MFNQLNRRKPPTLCDPLRGASWGRFSWFVVNIGVGVMIGLFIAASALTDPKEPPPKALPALPPTPAPVVDQRPFVTAEPTVAGASTSPPRPSAAASSRRAPVHSSGTGQAPQPAPRPNLTGRYRLLDSFGDSFIGEVLVSNVSGTPRRWSVTLRFPSNVGGLRTAWVEGAPQATLRQSGRTFVFTSTVTLEQQSSVPLRFHFDRYGRDVRPEVCTVERTCTY
jgi:hypothetical protein